MADFTQADLDRINNLIAKGAGVTAITMEDQTLTLASADDIQKLRSMIKREVEPPVTFRFAVTDKGF